MKPVNKTLLQLVPYAIILIIIFGIRELMNRETINPTLALVLLFVAIGLGYLAKRFIRYKYPELAPPKEDIEAELAEIQQESENTVDLPRTPLSTLFEVITAGLFAVALYRIISLGCYLLLIPFVFAAIYAFFQLLRVYYTDVRKDLDKQEIATMCKAVSLKRRVRAIYFGLVVLVMTFVGYPDGDYSWRNVFISAALLYLPLFSILRLLTPGSIKLSDAGKEISLSRMKISRSLEGSIYEIVTIVLLICAWGAAAYYHQFAGKGIMDQPVAELILCSIFAIDALVLAYFPKWMGNALFFSNTQQVYIDVKRHRVLAVEIAILALIIPFLPYFQDLQSHLLGEGKIGRYFSWYMMFILFHATTYNDKIKKAGQPEKATDQEDNKIKNS